MKKLEPFLFVAAFVILSAGLASEGARAAALLRKVPVTPKELYEILASKGSKQLQIVDVRPDVEDNFEDSHIPGAIPFPNCELNDTPDEARDVLERTVPTIIVSEGGDEELYARCAEHFTSPRNLAGGLEAWIDADLPEDVGEYEAPTVSAGGGCL